MKKMNLLFGTIGSLMLISSVTSCGINSGSALSDKAKRNIEMLTGIKLLETSFLPNGSIQKVASNDVNEDEIAKILPSIDTLLNNGTLIESKVEEVNNEINGVTYSFKEVINYKDSELKDATYVLYYNKDQKSISHLFDFDDETISYEKLNGVVMMKENTYYPFSSKSLTEVEEGEKETERVLTINIDSDTYVKVVEEYETEGNEKETEFSYTLFDNDKRFSYSISIENENSKFTEVEYKLNSVEYEVTKVKKDGELVYKVEREGRNEIEKIYYYKKIVLDDGTSKFERI